MNAVVTILGAAAVALGGWAVWRSQASGSLRPTLAPLTSDSLVPTADAMTGWVPYSSPDHVVTVLLPAQPKVTAGSLRVGGTPATRTVYQAGQITVEVATLATPAPGDRLDALIADVATVLEQQTRDLSLRTETTVAGRRALELEVTGAANAPVLVTVVIDHSRLVMLVSHGLPLATHRQFVASLQLAAG